MAIKLKGTGHALPDRVVTNEELATLVDTGDEWIREGTGIGRSPVSTGETVADLAVVAA